MSADVRRFADVESMQHAAAEHMVTRMRAACTARKECCLALSGGSTPKRLFELLAEHPFREQVDWDMIEFFWGDERPVPSDDELSNYRMAHEALLSKLDLRDDQIHRMQAERSDIDDAAEEYQAELAAVCGLTEGMVPILDVVLLGMGPDGHTASLFPGTAALDEVQRWVMPNQVPKLDATRMTMTPVILNQATDVIFLVAGASKAKALAAVLEGERDYERYPSQLIQPQRGQVVWFVDEAAASQLSGT